MDQMKILSYNLDTNQTEPTENICLFCSNHSHAYCGKRRIGVSDIYHCNSFGDNGKPKDIEKISDLNSGQLIRISDGENTIEIEQVA